ncbi:MAG: hypothetical protein HYT67_00085 [Candidatus Yanofskybacteria bacterium]|nr:hypothetical protein [Candidatus Yanofskybacteria bacterium]
MKFVWVILAIILAAPRPVEAQNGVGEFIKGVAKNVVLDPTTYGPFGASWLGKQLDWNSSQVFFEHGFMESNADFTINGLPFDKPKSYAAGNGKVILISLPVLQLSLINNASVSANERLLIRRHPKHRKLIKTLGWVEKIAVNGYIGYKYSHRNFRQWQRNKDLARQNGYR